MKAQIEVKSIGGKSYTGFVATFSYDMFAPDTVTIAFGDNVWIMDRELLVKGGDFGGDVAVVIDDIDTVVGLMDYKTGIATPVVFSTFDVQDFLHDATLGVNLPRMREAEVDNCIVEFYNWNNGLIA